MTILEVGGGLGSGEPPRVGTLETTGGHTSGVCVACSGRFGIEDGRLVAHASATANEREAVDEHSGERAD